ncbi:hypothetical protein FRX31_023507 [Thalictrum thalictroides]|uniref:Uncharacterized protein n=1 Tax=Thalictrum thalictroides TaxID=46969 RepID=A0A7J6VRU3_THATH|nr:hypothetical protein FRX31_023507 [Thalictrum thalictroides]
MSLNNVKLHFLDHYVVHFDPDIVLLAHFVEEMACPEDVLAQNDVVAPVVALFSDHQRDFRLLD